MKKKVLFLCTGNSCRSQMAEGLLRHFYGDKYEVYSAGINPTEINKHAIVVMNEIGIDISKQTSKSINEFTDKSFDVIITVCDNAKESCPFFPGQAERIHWSFIDPAEATGTLTEVLEKFRNIRDQIKSSITDTFANLIN